MQNSLKGSKTKKFLEYLTKIPDRKSLTKSKSFQLKVFKIPVSTKGLYRSTNATLFVKQKVFQQLRLFFVCTPISASPLLFPAHIERKDSPASKDPKKKLFEKKVKGGKNEAGSGICYTKKSFAKLFLNYNFLRILIREKKLKGSDQKSLVNSSAIFNDPNILQKLNLTDLKLKILFIVEYPGYILPYLILIPLLEIGLIKKLFFKLKNPF